MQKLLLVFLVILSAIALHGQEPHTVLAVAPHYPPIAVLARVVGDVSVLVKVNKEGAVISAETSSALSLLKKASEDAAKQWKFQPSSDEERQVLLHFRYVLLAEAEKPSTEIKFFPPYEVAVEMHPAKPNISY